MNPSAINSTNVRTPLQAPWLLRAGLASLGAVAPPVGALLGERLFLTPPRHAAPPGEREALASGAAFAVPFRGGRLRGWRFGEGPAVLLVHGWGGRAGQLAPLAAALAQAGCSALAFDGPAHGDSSGRLASVPLFAEAVTALSERFGARAAVAHSMGAAGTAVAILGGLKLDAAVFVGPPRSPAAFFKQFSRALSLGRALERATRRRLERRFGLSLDAFDLPRLAGDARTPLLVVHDRNDAEVPFADGEAIAASWRGARLLATDGLGHRRILRDPEVLGEVRRFVAERIGRCQCGRPATCVEDGRRLCESCALETWLRDREARRGHVGPTARARARVGEPSRLEPDQRLHDGGGGDALVDPQAPDGGEPFTGRERPLLAGPREPVGDGRVTRDRPFAAPDAGSRPRAFHRTM